MPLLCRSSPPDLHCRYAVVVGGEADGSRLLAAVKLGTPFATFPTRVPDYSFYRLVCDGPQCTPFPTPTHFSHHPTSPPWVVAGCAVVGWGAGHACPCCVMGLHHVQEWLDGRTLLYRLPIRSASRPRPCALIQPLASASMWQYVWLCARRRSMFAYVRERGWGVPGRGDLSLRLEEYTMCDDGR